MAKHSFHSILLLFAALSFGFTFDDNVPKTTRTQVLTDLSFVQTIQSKTESNLHKQIFGSVAGEDYDRYFNERINTIGMDGCSSPTAVACVIPFVDSSKMWLTQNYIKFSHPQIARLMVLFHEARHTETQNRHWPHAMCPIPFLNANKQPVKSIWTGADLAGHPSCDSTPFGAYGSSLIMLKNISRFCTNCSEKVKMDAGVYADDQLDRITRADALKEIRQDLYEDTGGESDDIEMWPAA